MNLSSVESVVWTSSTKRVWENIWRGFWSFKLYFLLNIFRVHEPKEQVQPSKYKCDRCSEEFESKVFLPWKHYQWIYWIYSFKDAFKHHKLPELLDCELCKRRGEVAHLSKIYFKIFINIKVSTLPSKCELNFHIITHRTGRPKVIISHWIISSDVMNSGLKFCPKVI